MLNLCFVRGIFSGLDLPDGRLDARLALDQIVELHRYPHAIVGIRIVRFRGARGRYGKKEHYAENDRLYEFAHLHVHRPFCAATVAIHIGCIRS